MATGATDRLINRHFLVVDDEQFIRTLVAGFLKQSGASAVLEAADGHHAIKTILKYDLAFDAIICDIKMKPMNGLEFLSAIRTGTEGVKRNIPVLMFTSHPELAQVDEAMRLDADAFLVKPIGREALIDRVVRVLEHSVAIQPAKHYADIGREIGIPASPASFAAAPQPQGHLEPVRMPAMLAKKVRIEKVKVNSILAEDIYVGRPRKLLMSENAVLTKGTLDRLRDLHQVSDNIWSVLVFEPNQAAAI